MSATVLFPTINPNQCVNLTLNDFGAFLDCAVKNPLTGEYTMVYSGPCVVDPDRLIHNRAEREAVIAKIFA